VIRVVPRPVLVRLTPPNGVAFDKHLPDVHGDFECARLDELGGAALDRDAPKLGVQSAF